MPGRVLGPVARSWLVGLFRDLHVEWVVTSLSALIILP